jgi:hypothetical protein
MRARRWFLFVAVTMWVFVLAGCDDDDSNGTDTAPGPLVLTALQLEEVPPAGEAVAELMGVGGVDHDTRAPQMVPVVLPRGTVLEAHHYWSTDAGDPTMGEGPVDWVSVTVVLVDDPADVQPLIDEVTSIDEGYVQWVPVTVRGATAAQESVTIHYEGEPTDEPEFSSIIARRDGLIVLVSAAGTDDERRAEAALGTAELVFQRANDIAES